MNLFWTTRSITPNREDHLTEFFASALTESDHFRKSYYDFVIKPFADRGGWGPATIQTIETQVDYPGTTCCPDLVLSLSNGKKVICEHKLDALETMGPEKDPRKQLERYLDLPIDGVAYVRSAWKTTTEKVLSHPKYIKPENGAHFLWRDFYPLLFKTDNLIASWLADGFRRLGFTPPHPSIGEMTGPDIEVVRENRRNFAKHWGKTRSFAHSLGWKIETGSIVELYLLNNDQSSVTEVFISPAQFSRFLIRITPKEGFAEQILTAMEAITPLGCSFEVMKREVPRKQGKVNVIDLTATLDEILGQKALTSEEIEQKLFDFIKPYILAINS